MGVNSAAKQRGRGIPMKVGVIAEVRKSMARTPS
jgi:hypothetical protein